MIEAVTLPLPAEVFNAEVHRSLLFGKRSQVAECHRKGKGKRDWAASGSGAADALGQRRQDVERAGQRRELFADRR